MTALDRVTKILIEVLGSNPKDIVPNATLKVDLDADSLNLVEIVMGMEEEFGLTIPDEESEKLLTVQAILDYLKSKGIE
jgi:acyl carrier protein